MNRIVWMGIGVAIGVIAFRKVTEAQSPRPRRPEPGRGHGWPTACYDFADAVRAGMRERETELRAALGVESQDLARR